MANDYDKSGFYLSRAEILYERSDYDSLFYYYSEALEISVETGDTIKEIQCYLGLAEYCRLQSDYQNSTVNLERAEGLLTKKLKDYSDIMAGICYIRGKILAVQGEFKEAIRYVRMASSIHGGQNKQKDARYLNYLGTIYYKTGDLDSAEYYYRQSFGLINSVAKEPAVEQSWYYLNMSQIHIRRGEFDEALECLQNNIRISVELFGPDFKDLSSSYLNLAYYYITAGMNDTASFCLDKAEFLISNDRTSGGTLLPVLYGCRGFLSYSEGDYLKAEKGYYQALEEAIKIYGSSHPLLFSYYNNYATTLKAMGNYKDALRFYHLSLKCVEKLHPSQLVSSYYNLATTYAVTGQSEEANYYYNKLIAGRSEYYGTSHPLIAYDYLSYGDFLCRTGKQDEAKKYLERALEIRIKSYGEKHYLTSEAYLYLGRYYNQENNPEMALQYFQNALISVAEKFENRNYISNPEISEDINLLSLLKTLKDKALTLEKLCEIKINEWENIEYRDASYHTYSSAIDVILRMQNDWLTEESRLYLSENENETFLSLIRISLDLYELTGKEEYIAAGFETAEKMKYSTLLATIRDQKALDEGKVPENLKKIDREIRMELTAYNNLIAMEYEKDSPDSVKLMNWNLKIFDLNSKRKGLALQLSKKYPDYFSLKYFPEIMSAKAIRNKLDNDDVITEYVLYDTMLVAFNLDKHKSTYRRTRIDSSFYRDILLVNDFVRTDYFNSTSVQIEEYLSAASRLYKILFADYLKGDNKHLLIIPDGSLAYIPFDVLLYKPVEGKDYNFGKLPYLVNKYPLRYAYSATLLFQSDFRKGRAGKRLLAFAPSDPETGGNEIRATLKPLVGSAKEVRSIINIVGGDFRIGNEASEFSFKELSSEYRILHLAAHAFIDEEDPLNSTVVFSSNNEGGEDGLLKVFEIYNLDLNASMVVLSACNTGYGKLKRGEGIMSMARAFFYAGIPNVVMTLWSVGDESGGKLMAFFYKNLVKGETKDVAMRNAKLSFIEEADPIIQHPYYWSGYVVVGDCSAVFKPGITKYLIIGMILVFSVLGFLYKDKLFRKSRR